MRANIQRILDAFLAGKSALDNTCRTDGETIYSYDMPIAVKRGKKILVAPLDQAPSRTTKAQIRALHGALIGSGDVRSGSPKWPAKYRDIKLPSVKVERLAPTMKMGESRRRSRLFGWNRS